MKPTSYRDNHPFRMEDMFLTKREFLGRFGTGFGALGLAAMMQPTLLREAAAQENRSNPLAPRQPHFEPKAKRVLHIFAQGAQSHLDTWDPKPELAKQGGKTVGGRELLAPQIPFKKYGKSGLEFAEVWPNLGRHADDMTILRGMHTDVPAHEQATLMMNTGDFQQPKPSMGTWVLYGLGTENQNLPGFISLSPGGMPDAKNWGNAFMPGAYQGTFVNSQNTKVEDIIKNIKSNFASQSDQRKQLDLLYKLNEMHKQRRQADSELEARVRSFELAYRMQTDATEAFDLSREKPETVERYGNNAQGRQLLIAKRLLERGVRFVQVWQGGWDTHNGIPQTVPRLAGEIDKGIGAIMDDLKQSGLFKDTIIYYSTEFGRTSARDGMTGRNHNNKAMSAWVAGGAVKGGVAYGATDELGSAAVENTMHVHDLHATLLHMLGFNHEELTFKSGGRDFRLTNREGKVAKAIIS